MEEPGSFSGNESSPRPHRGPDAKNRMSLAIFMRLVATVFKEPDIWTRASWQASASNLFGAVTNGNPIESQFSVIKNKKIS